jgi:hypothetical protein
MARRIAAIFGLVAVIFLALTLLYRVYLHHSQAEPYVDESDRAFVSLDAGAA